MTIVGHGYGISPGGASSTIIADKISVFVSLTASVGQVFDVAKDSCGREVHNFCFTRGDNPTVVVELVETGTTTPIDLTGATAKLSVHSVEFPVDVSTQIFELAGAIQAPATGGVVHFQPTTIEANQPAAEYYYQVQVVFADGTRRTFVTGLWEYDGADLVDTWLD